MARRPPQTDPEELKDAFKRAAEIAAVVPEAMQEAAFHRALDQILGREPADGPGRGGSRSRQQQTKIDDKTPGADSAQQLIDGINRTEYPEVAAASKVLDRALAVVRVASRDVAIDGLSAPQIARVLTDKFRLRTSRQAVTQALGSAHTMVDTVKRAGTTAYRIMQPGEDHLEAGGRAQKAGETAAPPKPSRRRKRRSPKASAPASPAAKADSEEGGQKSVSRRSRRRGPKMMLSELIDEGFFSQPRTISEAQEQLRHKKGVRFTLQDLSPAFVRLLRDRRLDRERNESGQYEYSAS